ncbi:oligosaccharide flippase family protein [Shewanella putrefaciens]|uniref:oligosaccharide flippase family protein n=1 Tax=Shewanella putrefaciens TaxID=24 RepID=UPI0018E80C1C|nr:oligosaccharide flippase family protein [Shewanella putrefaciens]
MKKNQAFYLFGDLVSKCFPFFLLPFVSNNYGPEALLIYSNVVLIYTVVTILFSVTFSTYVSTVFFKSTDDYVEVIGICYRLSPWCFGVMSLFFTYSFIIGFSSPLGFYIATFAISFTFLPTSVLLSVFQSSGNAKYYILLANLKNFIFLIIFLLFFVVYEINSYEVVNFSFLVASLISNIFGYYFYIKFASVERDFTIRASGVRKILKFGLPLIPIAVFNPLRTSLDRAFIISVLGAQVAGVYSGYYQLSSIVLLFSASQVKAVTPVLLNSLKNSDNVAFFNEIFKVQRVLFICTILLVIFLYYGSGLILGEIFGDYIYFCLMPLFFLFQCSASFYTCFYQYHGKNILLLKYNLIGLLGYSFIIGLCFILKVNYMFFSMLMVLASFLYFVLIYFRTHYNANKT